MGCFASKAGPSGRGSGDGRGQAAGTTKFFTIVDQFNNLDQVQEELRRAGLESSNIIVAVDYTKSNEWAGKSSFSGQNLHTLGQQPNPYEQAITIIGKTLSAFDDDNLFPCYGFGDATTRDQQVFSFLPGDKSLVGLDNALARYREITPTVKLAGPTSFAPAIRQACKIVSQSGGQYHILLLVADGQVTRSSDMPAHVHSPQEAATIKAIVDASHLPLSIVMVGVGDGPWDLMEEFDDKLPQRAFDNFQFVNYTECAQRYPTGPRRDAAFALRALMEIPEQFKAIQRLGLLGRPVQPPPGCSRPLDPPSTAAAAASTSSCAAAANGSGTKSASGGETSGAANANRNRASGNGGSASCSGAAVGGRLTEDGGRPRTSMEGPGGGSRGMSISGVSAAGAELEDGKPDAMFVCPITQEVMSDPVMAADGFTYDRAALQQWLASGKRTSPMTNARLAHTELTPNHTLRSAIREWQDKQKRLSATGQ